MAELSLKNKKPYSIIIAKDDFTKQTVVNCVMTGWKGWLTSLGFYMGSSSNGYDTSRFFFNFENVGGKYYLLMSYKARDFKIDKLCSLHLLLDNSGVISLAPIANPVKSNNGTSMGSDHMCKFLLSSADLDELEKSKFIKWRITNGEGVAIKSGENECCNSQWNDEVTDYILKRSYKLFQSFIKEFRKVVKDNVSPVELDDNLESGTKQRECYVYLMIDTTNNFYKIGISNKPQYREHTLQSDKPTIELVCSKAYPTRTIAEAIESSLHRVYASKRIRGEWFNLDESDIDIIRKTLT